MSIKDFLLARIAEDETLARAAIQPSEMHPYGDTRLPVTPVERWGDDVRGHLGGTWGEHCAQHAPVRVLRECEAKRFLVKQVSNVAWGGYAVRDVVLEALAATYADHPDHQEEWRVG